MEKPELLAAPALPPDPLEATQPVTGWQVGPAALLQQLPITPPRSRSNKRKWIIGGVVGVLALGVIAN